MAKSRPQSKHSRAARRAASPSLDLDKSLTSLPRAEETTVQRESILADRANAGVSKKKSKSKPLTKAQRARQQKGVERAEAVMDQLESKVNRSISRAKVVKARRGEWEDLNRKVSKTMFQALADEADDADDAMMDDSAPAKKSKPATQSTFAAQNLAVDQHADNDEDDEIT
ncbi:Alb1 domain-containing protein [Aspergillus saccharolyticus JOP 1030-1]|uniref:Alb1-domain-containing protein n=1 Tax=Aspergillus saccharolyticus JOP 1030-1 TaxID=1450539 RepID=A0A318ZR55_9EURO|nr:hypothetical protein BP01DRAFT_352118 [Aspergillus saccharolyticus JOP 1030-1]PYH49547.1 hypothetical protein BP01DRAFT_352118 [Aspergillus saccharolyticus JOP 1030-1]